MSLKPIFTDMHADVKKYGEIATVLKESLREIFKTEHAYDHNGEGVDAYFRFPSHTLEFQSRRDLPYSNSGEIKIELNGNATISNAYNYGEHPTVFREVIIDISKDTVGAAVSRILFTYAVMEGDSFKNGLEAIVCPELVAQRELMQEQVTKQQRAQQSNFNQQREQQSSFMRHQGGQALPSL